MLRHVFEDNLVISSAVIIEPTSSNTGIGLAIVSKAYGLKNVFKMPRKMSIEKELILWAYGGHVIRTPAEASPADPLSYYSVTEALKTIYGVLGGLLKTINWPQSPSTSKIS